MTSLSKLSKIAFEINADKNLDQYQDIKFDEVKDNLSKKNQDDSIIEAQENTELIILPLSRHCNQLFRDFLCCDIIPVTARPRYFKN